MGALTVNDVLRRENLPTIGPTGDVRNQPANWTTLNASPEPPSAPHPQPEPTPTNAIADHTAPINAANRALLQDRLDRLVSLEAKQTEEARSRGRNLSTWADKFYPQHKARMRDGLLTAVGCIFAQHGRSDAESYTDQVVSTWLSESRLELTTGSDLTSRSTSLVDSITKDAQCNVAA